MTLHKAIGCSIWIIYLQISFSAAQGTAILDNPCAYTDCITGNTCIAIPDPNNCTGPESCGMKATCVPNGSQNSNVEFETYCGENKCRPGYVCRFVSTSCIQGRSCHPVLTCVRFPGMPSKYPNQNKDTYQYSSGNRPELACGNMKCKNGTVCAMEKDCTGVKNPSEQTCPLVPICKISIKENQDQEDSSDL